LYDASENKTSLERFHGNKITKSLEGSGISYVLQYRSDLSCFVFQSEMKSDRVYQRSDSLTAVPQIHDSWCSLSLPLEWEGISIKTITFSQDEVFDSLKVG